LQRRATIGNELIKFKHHKLQLFIYRLWLLQLPPRAALLCAPEEP
jgi:hypothetical protein